MHDRVKLNSKSHNKKICYFYVKEYVCKNFNFKKIYINISVKS